MCPLKRHRNSDPARTSELLQHPAPFPHAKEPANFGEMAGSRQGTGTGEQGLKHPVSPANREPGGQQHRNSGAHLKTLLFGQR